MPSVETARILIALSLGTQTAVVAMSTSLFREQDRKWPSTLRSLRWVAGGLLGSSVVSACRWSSAFPALPLVAAIAAPADTVHTGRNGRRNAILAIPALVLTVVSLVTPESAYTWTPASITPIDGVALLGLTLCAAACVRASAHSCLNLMGDGLPRHWSFPVAYAALTVVWGSYAVASLLHRGTLLAHHSADELLTASWLAWTASRVGMWRRHPWLDGAAVLLAAAMLAWASVQY